MTSLEEQEEIEEQTTVTKEYLLEREPSKRCFILEVNKNEGFRLLVADKEKKDDEAYCLIDGSNLVEFGMFGVYQGKVPELDCNFGKNVLESNITWSKYELTDNQQEKCNHFWEESNVQEGLMFCGKCMMRLEDFCNHSKKYNTPQKETKEIEEPKAKPMEDLYMYDHFDDKQI